MPARFKCLVTICFLCCNSITMSLANSALIEKIQLNDKDYVTLYAPYLDTKIPINPINVCPSAWQGYYAEWHIDKNRLYLVRVITHKPDTTTMPASEIDKYYEIDQPVSCVGDHRIKLENIYGHSKPVFAVWFSGNIQLGDGEPMTYKKEVIESGYSHHITLSFDKGVLKHKRVIDQSDSFAKCGSNGQKYHDFYKDKSKISAIQQKNYDDWLAATNCQAKIIEDIDY